MEEKYELMVIFPADLGEEGVKKEIEELRHQIKGEGEIHNIDLWGKRELSYRIKKHDSGFYVVLSMTFLGEKISEFEKMLNISPAVIRYLLIKTPNNYQFKSFQQYQDEAEQAEAEEEKKKKDAQDVKDQSERDRAAKMAARLKPKAEPKPEPKVAVKKEVAKEVEEEVVEEEEVKTEKKPRKAAPEKSNLEDLDKKLKSIIDDPDISL